MNAYLTLLIVLAMVMPLESMGQVMHRQPTLEGNASRLFSASKKEGISSLLIKPPFRLSENKLYKNGMNCELWKKIIESKGKENSDSITILHIGDSHVKGNFFPETTGRLLQNSLGAIRYMWYGINGATFLSFANKADFDQIVSIAPDFIIVSFGTNESHGRNFNTQVLYKQIDLLMEQLRLRLPDTQVLLTTPPGSYLSAYKKQQGRSYTPNPNTEKVAMTIRKYAVSHNIMLWDLFEVAGGSTAACQNWKDSGLLYKDHIHYSAEGYALQGQLLYEAFIKAYYDYTYE